MKTGQSYAIASFVFGILAFLGSLAMFISGPMGVASVICGALSLQEKPDSEIRRMATIGIVLSSVAVAISVCVAVVANLLTGGH